MRRVLFRTRLFRIDTCCRTPSGAGGVRRQELNTYINIIYLYISSELTRELLREYILGHLLTPPMVHEHKQKYSTEHSKEWSKIRCVSF